MQTLTRVVFVAASLTVSSAVALGQSSPTATGHWEGQIQTPNRELGLVVDLARNAAGAWIGSMSVTQSTSIDVPLSDIVVDGAKVRFTASLPNRSSFEGTLSADASSLAGTATGARGSVPFKLTRSGEPNVKVPPTSSRLPKELEGTWEGAVDVGGTARRLGLRLSPAADGTGQGMLILVDEGGLEIPVTTVTVKDKQLRVESRAVSGTYQGTLGTNGEIVGEWAQGPNRFPLTFKRR